MARNRFPLFITALMLCIPLSSAQADIYQYVDENGVIHFTNVGSGKNQKRVASESRRVAKAETQAAETNSKEPAAAPAKPSSADIPSAYLQIIDTACAKYGVDSSLVHAIVRVESDFNPYALSRKGAMGLMQLMPQTALEMDVKNSFSPHENIHGGVKYLRYLLDRYEGNISLALAAYNSGETAVQRWGTIPPFKETQNYVKKIMRLYNGTGGAFAPRYTIYIGYAEDGSLLLTDNPTNHKGTNLSRGTGKSL